MGNELSRKISYKKSTIKKFKPRRITIPTIRRRNPSSNSTMYAHHDLHQSPQSSQIKCRHFFRFFDDQGWCKTCTINGWSSGKNEKGRRCSRTEPIKVVLKSIKNSKNMSSYYIKSLKEYYRYSALICPQRIQNYLEFYGVTQNPTSGEYLLVIQHATFGSLRQFMHSSPSTFASFKWSEKLWWCIKIMNEFLRADEQASILFQENEMFEQEEEMKDKTWFTSRLWTFKLNNDSTTELITSTEIMENWEMQQSQESEQNSQRITTEPENNTSN
ncbi:13960_t:CDS:2, partial [Dentiscutata erythropus]